MNVKNIASGALKLMPVISLIVASISLYITIENKAEISRIETKYLEELTIKDSDKFEILEPTDSSSLMLNKTYHFKASFSGELTKDYELWLIGRSGGRYKILCGERPLHLNKVQKLVSYSGLRFNYFDGDGNSDWELMLCYVTKMGRKAIDDFDNRNFDELPKGISILQAVQVRVADY